MTRTFSISEFVPYACHMLGIGMPGSPPDPDLIRKELQKLNQKKDPIHDFEVKNDRHDHVTHDHELTITEYEFNTRKNYIGKNLRSIVRDYFLSDRKFLHATSATDDFIICDDGDGRYDSGDFVFSTGNPATWSHRIAPDFAKTPYLNKPWTEIINDLSVDPNISLTDTAHIIAELPKNQASLAPEERQAALSSIDAIIARFDKIAGADFSNIHVGDPLQDYFLCLMMLMEKGWATPVLAALKKLDDAQWARLFNHTRLPLSTSRAFARAFSIAATEVNTLNFSDADPLAWRLMASTAQAHLWTISSVTSSEHEKNIAKETLFSALELASTAIHPALRLVALEGLGNLANAGILDHGDIPRLARAIRDYSSPKEEDIKALLTIGQYDARANRQMLMRPAPQQMNLFEDANAAESTRGDYETDGVLTYWLMDFNHEIIEKFFSVLIAIDAPDSVASELIKFLARDQFDGQAKSKDLAYVDYYKGAEALNALGRLYGNEKWISTAFNLHINNQIGREIERNPELVDRMMADFGVDNKTLISSWDDDNHRLARNFTVLQLARSAIEKGTDLNTFSSLSKDEKIAILNDDFSGASPSDMDALGRYLENNKDTLLKIVDGTHSGEIPFELLESETFQRWMNWQHFGPFVIDPQESCLLAMRADLKRKAWSWEFASLSEDELVTRKDLYLTILEDFKTNPFAWLRLDLVMGAYRSKDTDLRIAALEVLQSLDLPQEKLASLIDEPAPISPEEILKAYDDLACGAERKKPVRALFPDETLRTPDNPLAFDENGDSKLTAIFWANGSELMDFPSDDAPHAYQKHLGNMARDYGEMTLEEMVRLLRDPAAVSPGNHKFRYLSERNNLSSIIVDAFVTDKVLQKVLTDSFLHAGKSGSGPVNAVLTIYLRDWSERHQATLIELFREFHLTYPGGDPLEHLASSGHKFVRDKFIIRELRAAIDSGHDARPIIMAYLEETETKISTMDKRITKIDILLADDPRKADDYAQVFSGMNAQDFRDALEKERQLALEERRLWIDAMANLM